MLKIDLNCDMGESYGAYTIGADAAAAPYISSANVACGFHAADPTVMDKTVSLLQKNNVAIGAHPGFPDLMGFGRRNLQVQPAEAKAYVQYQIGALWAFCKARGLPLQHVKPHGALYNMAGKDYALARAICEGIAEINPQLILLGLSGSALCSAAEDVGLRCAREVFADRAYTEDGALVPRTEAGAMITDADEAIARVIGMVKSGKVKALTGKEIAIKADSVCVHGDGEKALAFVKKIRAALTAENICIAPLAEIV